jgi:dihydrofolate reductase
MTGRIIIDIFSTLDGVGQGPGSRREDPSGGFRFSGWQGPVSDDVVGEHVLAGIETLDALLLGRRTYDIWADYWPALGDSNPIAEKFNAVPKYVASRTARTLDWEGSVLFGSGAGLSGEGAGVSGAGAGVSGAGLQREVAALRERHREIHVIGSLDFAQTLLGAQLFDVLNLWVFPVVLGEGKKIFPLGAAPANLELIEPPTVAGTGAVLLRYAPAGQPRQGDIA